MKHFGLVDALTRTNDQRECAANQRDRKFLFETIQDSVIQCNNGAGKSFDRVFQVFVNTHQTEFFAGSVEPQWED